jgi:choline dehydrogenase-like flavoprotein
MIDNPDTIESGRTIETDLCVIGGGTAGLAVANHFASTNRQAVVLESGGLGFSKSLTALPRNIFHHVFGEQSLTAGDNLGDPYYLLRLTRLRSLGGTSRALARHGLRSRPLDEIDFEVREGIDHTGWPFTRSHLDAFYKLAQAFAGLGPYEYNGRYWEHPDRPQLTLAGDDVSTSIFQYGAVDYIERHIRSVGTAANIRVLTNATVTRLQKETSSSTVDNIEVRTLKGKTFFVRARIYVLAAGGIENARILLHSNRISRSPLTSNPDLVGRFFMEHPHFVGGFVALHHDRDLPNLNLYGRVSLREATIEGAVRLADTTLRRERLLNSISFLHPSHREDCRPGMMSTWTIRRAMRWGPYTSALRPYLASALAGFPDIAKFTARRLGMFKRQASLIGFNVMAEQQPNPDSRVTLSDKTDRLGVPRVSLDWRITDFDRYSMRRSLQIVARTMERSKLGRIVWILGDESPPVLIRGGWHHMGTTRMHRDSRMGVVDDNCRVHGCENLFVAGSSVFPTGGASNPTLTIVALALRLAKHIEHLG